MIKKSKKLASIPVEHIRQDPCERNNVAFKFSNIVLLMDQTLAMYKQTEVPRLNRPKDPRSDPKYFNYTWTNWLDYYEPSSDDFEDSHHLEFNDELIQQLMSNKFMQF